MNKRRNFLKQLTIGSLLSAWVLKPTAIVASEPPIGNVLLHHVFFWLKEPENPEARKQFETAVKKLFSIEQVGLHHLGIPASTEKREVVDHSYSYSMLLSFEGTKEQNAYQVHPVHQQFVAENSHLWSKVVVYDSIDLPSQKIN